MHIDQKPEAHPGGSATVTQMNWLRMNYYDKYDNWISFKEIAQVNAWILTRTLCFRTWEHGEDGGEGVELEAVDDVAGVDELQTHEAETNHQQHDVEQLGHQRQPQHPCTPTPRSEVSFVSALTMAKWRTGWITSSVINRADQVQLVCGTLLLLAFYLIF